MKSKCENGFRIQAAELPSFPILNYNIGQINAFARTSRGHLLEKPFERRVHVFGVLLGFALGCLARPFLSRLRFASHTVLFSPYVRRLHASDLFVFHHGHRTSNGNLSQGGRWHDLSGLSSFRSIDPICQFASL